MGTLPRVLVTLCLLWNFCASAQQATPILPDPKLTPGDVFDVTAQDVCVPGYAEKVRAVPAWLKRQAYAEYGITQYKTGDYEVDHLIPLSNSIRNHWPQSTHKLVCAGQLETRNQTEAQRGTHRKSIEKDQVLHL